MISKKLTVFLVAITIVITAIVAFKLVDKSYALPLPDKPTINSIVKTSDQPLQVQIKYNLSNMQNEYKIEILNNTESKVYSDNVSKYNGENEYYVNDLEKGKTYEFVVKICDEDSNCSQSDSKSIELEPDNQGQNQQPSITPVDPPLGKVTSITATRITDNRLSVKWNIAPNATGYKFRYKMSTTTKWYEYKFVTTSANIKSLRANTKYDISVMPIKNNENGVWYTKTFLTNPRVPYTYDFGARVLNYSQVKLSWKKNASINASYEIYRSTNGKNWSKIRTFGRNTTSFTDKGLSANKVYYYKLRTMDNKSQRGKVFYNSFTGNRRVVTPLKDNKTYILISIKNQKLWYYKKGRLILQSKVVTGKSGKNHTPKGTYKIRSKSRSRYLIGRDYVSFVNYWMLIDRRTQIGIHDATWRSKFGGNIYKRNGSHGCINLPLKTAKQIYKKAPVGTKVIIK